MVWLCSPCHQKAHQETRPPREPKPRKSRPPKPVPPRTQEQDLAQGFADCEALVSAGLLAQAEKEDAAARFLRDRAENLLLSENPHAVTLLAERAEYRAACLREMSLAVSLGQFRTAECNEKAIVAAHREAAGFNSSKAGGEARSRALSPEERAEIARRGAVLRFWEPACTVPLGLPGGGPPRDPGASRDRPAPAARGEPAGDPRRGHRLGDLPGRPGQPRPTRPRRGLGRRTSGPGRTPPAASRSGPATKTTHRTRTTTRAPPPGGRGTAPPSRRNHELHQPTALHRDSRSPL